MTDQDVRDFLERMAAEEQVPFPDTAPLTRRARRRAARTVLVGAIGVAAAIPVLFAGVGAIRSAPIPAYTPAPPPLPAPRSVALAYEIDGDIYVADADGLDPVRIANGAHLERGSDSCANGERASSYDFNGTPWSPDGQYLAFWDHGCPVPPGAWGTVVITDPEGTVIGSFPGEGWTISWSPDSTRIAVMDVWALEGQGDATIGVYGLDGTRHAALTVPSALVPSGDYSPAWSRDGSSILLSSVQVPLDGGAPTPLPDDHIFFGVYSPDGSRVAGVNDGSLVVNDAVGSDAQKVGSALEFWDVAWSPDGALVAFAAHDTELLVRDVATGADTLLVDVARPELLSVVEFSPDGDRILFTRWDADTSQSSLWSIGADGSDLRRVIARMGAADLQPQGLPS